MTMILDGQQIADLKGKAQKFLKEATRVYTNDEATAEDRVEAKSMLEAAQEIKGRIDDMIAVKAASAGLDAIAGFKRPNDDAPAPKGFKTFGQFLQAVYAAERGGDIHSSLKVWNDPTEPRTDTGAKGWVEPQSTKDLLESVGASGGFLVPVEQQTQLMMHESTVNVVRSRATIIPMRRRQISIPVLDQTGTAAGAPHWWGGVLARWTEEAEQKDETEPTFRQINLVAHKLVTYTEASDELLADSAISLEALLTQMFSQVIDWEEEEAFLNGTGVGMPLGIIPAPATIVVAPAAANALAVGDLANMLEAFVGTNPIWVMSRQWMSNLIQLNGPAGNPSFVFIPNAREGVPSLLFGHPIFWSEHSPQIGTLGSILLADMSKYLIGDRQGTTVDSSSHFRFRNDLTAWRATHRVDGQPWLSAPLTYSDGTTQVSPFVVLGANPS